ncbi:hypothetical protein J6590_103591 [Homalodisca vitripennis]|nr:hypothetical protein J6590_103591 [Homalodisca vitripennis]
MAHIWLNCPAICKIRKKFLGFLRQKGVLDGITLEMSDSRLQVTATGPWVALLLRSVFTLCLGATTLQIYAGLAQTIGIY